MPTLNQFTSLDFQQNLFVNALNSPNKAEAVFDLSGDYNVMDFIFAAMSNGQSRQINTKDGSFSKPLIGRSTPTAQVASATITGTGLTSTMALTFTDPNFNNFRYKEVLGDGTANMYQGRVIVHAPGSCTLEVASGNTGFTALMFAVGTTVSALFGASGIRGSSGMESLYEQPQYVTNQTGVIRDSLTIYRRDMIDTYVKWAGDNWYLAQQPMMMKRFARMLEKKAYYSGSQTVLNSPLEGTIQYSMGIRQAILDATRGGIYQPMTGDLTQSIFEGTMGRIADRKNSKKFLAKIGCGRGFLNQIQRIYGNYIQYAGNQNTFGGGSVKGIDFYNLAFNGVEVQLFMIPFFNDRELFPAVSTITGLGNFTRQQYTAIVFDEDQYSSADGQMLSAMEKVHFDAEVEYCYIPGMVGSSQKGSKMFSGDLRLAVSDKDACSIEIMSDVCHDVIAYRMGLFETLV